MGDMATEGHDTDAHVRAGAYGAHAPGCARCEERLTLPDFLLARIAEDEEVARYWGPRELASDEALWLSEIEGGGPVVVVDSARVLVECEAKRRVVESVERAMRLGTNGLGPSVLMHLAAVYADHPDYREEWRP